MRVPWPASPSLLLLLLLAPPGRLAGDPSQQQKQSKRDVVPPDVKVTTPASDDYYDSDYEDDPSEASTARPPQPDKGTPLLLPEVTFSCHGRSEGYYGDVQLRCEVFHYCKPDGVRFSFVCPPKSSFNQKLLICDYDPAAATLCPDSDLFFHLNDAPAVNASSVNETSPATEEPASTSQRHRLRKPVTRPATVPSTIPTDAPSTSKTASPQPVFGRPNLRTTTVPSTTVPTSTPPLITLPPSVPTSVLSPSATPASSPATTTSSPVPADQDDEDDWLDDSYPSVPVNASSIFDSLRQDNLSNVSLPWESSLGWPQLGSPWSSRNEHSHSLHSLPETTRPWWRQASPPPEPVSSVLYTPPRDSAQYAPPRDVSQPVQPTHESSQRYTPVFDRDAIFEHLRQASAEERPEDTYSTRYRDDGRRLLEPPRSEVTYSREQTQSYGYTPAYEHSQQDSPSYDSRASSDASNDLRANSFVVYDQHPGGGENRPAYDPYAEHPMRYPQIYGEEHYPRSREDHRVGHDIHGSEASKHYFSARITDFKGPEGQSYEAEHPLSAQQDNGDFSWAQFKDGGAYRYESLASDSSVTEVPKTDAEPKGTAPPPWKPMAEVLAGKETPRLSGSYHKTPSGYFEFRHGWKSSKRKRSTKGRHKRQLFSRLFKRQPIRIPQMNSLEPPRGVQVNEHSRWMPFPFGVSGFHPGANMMRVPPPPPGFQTSQEFQPDHKPERPPMQMPPQFFGQQPQFRRPPFFAENNFPQHHKVPSKFQQDGMQAQPWDFPLSGPPPREVMMRPGMQGPHFPVMNHGHTKESGHGPTPRPPPIDTVFHSTTPSSSIEITLRPMTLEDDSGDSERSTVGHGATPQNHLSHMNHQEGPVSYTEDPHSASSPFASGPTPRPGEFITEVEPPRFSLGNHEPHGNPPQFHHTREQSPGQVNLVVQDELIRHSGQTFPVNQHMPERQQEPHGNMHTHGDPDVRFGSRVPNVRPPFENFLPPVFSSRDPPRMSPQLNYVQWKNQQKLSHQVQRPPGRAPEGIYIPAHIANMPVNPQLMMGMVHQQSAHTRPQHGRRPPPSPDSVYPGRPGPGPLSFPGPRQRPMAPRPAEGPPPARAPQGQRPPPERPAMKRPVHTVQPEQQVQSPQQVHSPQQVKLTQPVRPVPPVPPMPPPAKPRRRKPGRRRRPKPSTPLPLHAPRVPSTSAPSVRDRSSVPPLRGTQITTPYSIEPLTFGGRTGPQHGQRRPVTNSPRATFRPATATRIVTSKTTTRPPQTTTSPYSNALRLSLKQSVSQKDDANKTYSWYGGWTKSTPSPSAVRHHMPTAIEATLAPAYKQAFTFPARIMATGQPTAVATTPSTWSWPREPSKASAVKWSSAPSTVTPAPTRAAPWSSSASVVRVFSSKIGSSVMATREMPKTTTTTTTSTTTTPRPKIIVDDKENVIGNGHDKGFPFEFFTDVGMLLSRTTPRTTPHPQPVYKPPSTIREPVTEVVTAISFSESGPVYLPKGSGLRFNNTAFAGA